MSQPWQPSSLEHPIVFPSFLLYPKFATSDFISGFHEDTTFGDQLEVMFPLTQEGQGDGQWADWDRAHAYYCDNLVIYAETNNKKLLKIGRNLTLRDVIKKAADLPAVNDRKDGLVLRDGLLSFVVLAKGDESHWVDDFKRARDSS